MLNLIQNTHKINDFEAFTIRVHSTIPVAAGLGSSAAVSVAITRAISQFFGLALDNPQISHLVYEIEKIQHGSPSGIDNSVITYQQPILFQRDLPILPINLTQPFTFLVGDTGIPSKTSASVGKVRKAREMELDRYNQYFDEIAAITVKAKNILEGSGTITQLGELLNQNHGILQKIGVSCHALDTLVTTAIDSGAYGAKLCGGGDGGNMIALVSEKTIEKVRAALIVAGAVRVITTNIEPTGQAHG
ncbi:MAG: mevalonate kinase [Anaerolineaceae bacterium]|nr:mevalonate kinase [Anaerolineaceae bacterium]